jgi:hypothetical protein
MTKDEIKAASVEELSKRHTELKDVIDMLNQTNSPTAFEDKIKLDLHLNRAYAEYEVVHKVLYHKLKLEFEEEYPSEY